MAGFRVVGYFGILPMQNVQTIQSETASHTPPANLMNDGLGLNRDPKSA